MSNQLHHFFFVVAVVTVALGVPGENLWCIRSMFPVLPVFPVFPVFPMLPVFPMFPKFPVFPVFPTFLNSCLFLPSSGVFSLYCCANIASLICRAPSISFHKMAKNDVYYPKMTFLKGLFIINNFTIWSLVLLRLVQMILDMHKKGSSCVILTPRVVQV